MKLPLSLLGLVLATASMVMGQNSSTAPVVPPAVSDQQQNAQPAQGQSEAQGEQGQNASAETGLSALGTRVQRAIASDSMLENSDVKVQIKGDQLVLTGTVSSQSVKDRAEQIAAPFATQNNLVLVNHISVQS